MRLQADWLHLPAAQRVCGLLADAGYQAWFVGGCVRNALLGVPVDDLDIATDATPDQVVKLATDAGLKVVPTGIAHGTVTLVTDGRGFEVTTFRRDVETDGRRAVVAFATTMAEDARRRDFTMNALYAGADGVVADPLGGLPDLQARRVRFIDDAAARIREDYLRILRFFRFHAHYGDPQGGIDPEGLAACADQAGMIGTLSKERIGHEMLKLMSAPDPAPAVAAMQACGVLHQILPGADGASLAPLVHVEQAAGLLPDPVRRLAVLGGSDVAEALRLSKSQALRLTQMHNADMTAGEAGYRLGVSMARDILAVQAARTGQEIDPEQAKQAKFGAAQTFPLSASDLMPRYVGPVIGRVLRSAEIRWIASGFRLSKAELIKDL